MLARGRIPRWLALALIGTVALPTLACVGGPRYRVVTNRQDPPDPSDPPPRPKRREVAEDAIEQLLAAHNAERKKAQLTKLVVNKRLTASAEAHAKDMADRRKMDHKGGDGSTPFDRIKSQGYNYRRAAENIAFGQYEVDVLMDGWMNSPGHKKNILGRFSQVGMAYATDKNGIPYWCVNFGTPLR